MACAHDQLEDSTHRTPAIRGGSSGVSAIILAAKQKDLLKQLTHSHSSEDVMLGRSASPHGEAEHYGSGEGTPAAGGTSASPSWDHGPRRGSPSPRLVHMAGTNLPPRDPARAAERDLKNEGLTDKEIPSSVCVEPIEAIEKRDSGTTRDELGRRDSRTTGDGLGRRDAGTTGDELGRRDSCTTGDEPPIHELKFENEVLRHQLLHVKVARSDLEKENETLKGLLELHIQSRSPLLPHTPADKPVVNSPKLKPVPLPRKLLEKQLSVECPKQSKLDVGQPGTASPLTSSCVMPPAADEPVPVKPPRRRDHKPPPPGAKPPPPGAKPPLPPLSPRTKQAVGTKGSALSGQPLLPPLAPSSRQRPHLPIAPSQSSVPSSSGASYKTTPIKHDSSWITSRYPGAKTPPLPHPNTALKVAHETTPGNVVVSTKAEPLQVSCKEEKSGDHSKEEGSGDQPKSKPQKARKFSFLNRPRPHISPKKEVKGDVEGRVRTGTEVQEEAGDPKDMNGRQKKAAARKHLSDSPDHERPVSVAENAPYKSRKVSSGSPTILLKGSGMSTPVMQSPTSWLDQHKTLEDVEDSGFDGDEGSDDEKGGTLKIVPKLKSVPERKPSSLDEDAEPDCAQLFEYVFVVSLKSEKGSPPTPQVTYSFPPAISFTGKDAALNSIPNFCFPDISHLKPCTNYRSETFSFILTDIEGSRRYGYCRRLLPSGTDPRLPEVFCIVSSYGCFSLYEHILDKVEQRRTVSSAAVFTFLQAIVANRFPKPGKTVSVRCIDIKAGEMETIEFSRPPDSRLEHVDFSILFTTLSHRKIIKLVSAILMERRIILCADSLTRLSSCAHAVMALIYPFVWQHVLIPVLPGDLVDFCCSPLPFMMGVLPACLKKMDGLDMEDDVLIVDLDKSKFVREVGDEDSILPSKLFKYLESVLGSPSVKSEYQKPAAKRTATEHSRADEIVVNSFLLFFTYLYGNYRRYIGTTEQGSYKSTFRESEFLESFKSKSTKRFLEAFQRTQMFDHFIAERENPITSDIVSKGLFDTKLPELKSRLEEIELFSSSKRRWRPFGKKK